MYSLIAADLDGTLLQNGIRTVREDLFETIHSYAKRGGVFLPASGRQYSNLRNLFAPVKDEISYICENGCLVFAQNVLIHREEMPLDEGRNLIRAIREIEGAEILVSGVDTCYVEKTEGSAFYKYIAEHVKNVTTFVQNLEDIPEPFFKISAFRQEGVDAFETELKNLFSDRLNVVTSGNRWLDVMPQDVHKGSALKILTDYLGIDLKDAVALGDHYNDTEILNIVGHPACVDNAMPEIKAICERQMADGCDLLTEYLRV